MMWGRICRIAQGAIGSSRSLELSFDPFGQVVGTRIGEMVTIAPIRRGQGSFESIEPPVAPSQYAEGRIEGEIFDAGTIIGADRRIELHHLATIGRNLGNQALQPDASFGGRGSRRR